MAKRAGLSGIGDLPPRDSETGAVHVVVETPRGSRSKIKFDEDLALFKIAHVLPAGAVFPFDFGFVPGTLAEDGDPLDVLVLFDGSTFAGCLVLARLVGVIEAEQVEEGRKSRNDRLLAVAVESRQHRDVESIGSVGAQLLEEIEHFFASYNEAHGKRFTPVGRHGPARAEELLRDAIALRRKADRGSKGRKSASGRRAKKNM
jgi:inorganic pyrophosphatase